MKKIYKRSQRGLSLSETALAMGLIAIASTLTFHAVGTVSQDSKIDLEINATLELVRNINRHFYVHDWYTGLSPSYAIKAGLVPNGYKISGSNIVNLWGQPLQIATRVGYNDSEYHIDTIGIPTESCHHFARGVALGVDEVEIYAAGAAVTTAKKVKTYDSNITETTLATACSSAASANGIAFRLTTR